jgi:hypothetical protein
MSGNINGVEMSWKDCLNCDCIDLTFDLSPFLLGIHHLKYFSSFNANPIEI